MRHARPKKKNRRALRTLKRVMILLLTIIIAAAVFLVGAIYILEKGPSTEARNLFVITVQQTSAAKPLARLFLSEETVREILDNSSAKDDDLETDPQLVAVDDTEGKDGIIIEDVYGPTYRGKMMIVEDPSRVYVYSIPDYNAASGMTVSQMVKREKAVAGTNGGGFYDKGGMGTGNAPAGIVISKGKWYSGSKTAKHQVIGFDSSNRLVIATIPGSEAVSRGIRDAVEWGPALIVNGEPVEVGNGGGLNPRTAIGQRADGAVLILVIDGRQPNSMGASYLDLIGIMQEYEAVNAANLDGGNSSSLVYEGEIITNPASLNGERAIPTGFMVEAR